MKICGTVRRPLRAIISARASGRSSILMTSNGAPLRSRSPVARVQNGHQSVKYTTIRGFAMPLAPGRSRLGQRQVFGTPGGKSAAQVERLGETLGDELPHGGGSEGTRVVVDDDHFFLLLLQSVARLQNLLTRHLPGAGYMASRKSLGGTQVENQGALVHQPHDILRRYGGDVLAARAQFVRNDQQGRNGRTAGIPGMMGDVFEKTVHACRS